MLIVQLCPALCNPMDCSPPGSSVHGLLQARTLEWVAIPFFKFTSLLFIFSCTGSLLLRHPLALVVVLGLSCPTACEILVPQSRTGLMSPVLEAKFLITGSPDNPCHLIVESRDFFIYPGCKLFIKYDFPVEKIYT